MKPWEKKRGSNKSKSSPSKTSKVKPWEKRRGSKSEEAQGAQVPSAMPNVLDAAGDVLGAAYDLSQVPVKMAASAVDKDTSVGDFLSNLRQEGSKAVEEAPTMQSALESRGVPGTKMLPEEVSMPYYPYNVEIPDAVNPTVSGTMGAVLETPFDPLTYVGGTKGASTLKSAAAKQAAKFERKGFENTADAIKKLMTKTSIDSQNMNAQEIGNTLYEMDLATLLDDPKELYKQLKGTDVMEPMTTAVGGKPVRAFKAKNQKDGIISRLDTDNSAIVGQIERDFPELQVPRGAIGFRVINTLNQTLSDPNTLAEYSPQIAKTIENKVVNKLLKSDVTESLTPTQIFNLRKEANSLLNAKEFRDYNDSDMALVKKVVMGIRNELDDTLKMALKGKQVDIGDGQIADAAQFFEVNNQRMKNLIQARELLKGVDFGKYDKPTLTRLIGSFLPMAAFGGTLSTVGGYGPGSGAAMGLGFEAVRKMQREIAKPKPEAWAGRYRNLQKGAEAMENMATPAGVIAPQLLREQQLNSRSPNSINPIVEDQLIPRSTDWIMAHPNMTRAKLLTSAPELAAQVSIALERGDEKTLRQVLPLVANQVPHLFENDDYKSFDGKIFDPEAKARYIDSVMNDPNMDSIEKAEVVDHLNRTHEVLR